MHSFLPVISIKIFNNDCSSSRKGNRKKRCNGKNTKRSFGKKIAKPFDYKSCCPFMYFAILYFICQNLP